jgi:putative hydrolase of the HAD superfamily
LADREGGKKTMNCQYLIFDLDNTLYSKESGMLKHIDQRIDDYIKDRLNLPLEQVTRIRTEYWRKYGTTLGGMVIQHRIDPQDYINYAFGFDVNHFIHTDSKLRLMLNHLNFRKAVFSNSPGMYVEAVLKALGVADCFEKIFDIHFCDYLGKPEPDSYQRVLNDLRVKAGKCIFVDDMRVNVQGASQAGMKAVWLSDQKTVPDIKWRIDRIYDLGPLVAELLAGRVSA